MTTLTFQIAVLDAAAVSLAALSDTIALAGDDAVTAIRTMATAVPGSAVEHTLPPVPVEPLSVAISGQCRQIAQRVAGGAQVYRDMEAALEAGLLAPARWTPVPR